MNITPSLCVHIVSILNMIQSCIYTARQNILPRMEPSPNLKRGTYRSRHTRNYVFASMLVAGLEGAPLPDCQMAKYSCLSARWQLNITSARPALSSPPFLLVHKQYFAQCLHLYNQFFVFLALYYNTVALCIIILLRAAPLSGGDRGYLSCRGR